MRQNGYHFYRLMRPIQCVAILVLELELTDVGFCKKNSREPYHSRSILNRCSHIPNANQFVVFESDERDYHNLSEIVGGISHITIRIRDHKEDEHSVFKCF